MTHKMLRLKPNALKFDHLYQRPPLRNHLAELAANFDPSLVGAVVVSRREDGDYVVDGQHRTLAAIAAERGDVAIDCVVHLDLTRSEEAALFLTLNRKRKPITRRTEWGAALAAGDPSVVAQAEAIERAGWKVNPSSTQVGQISAVTSLARLRALDPSGERDVTYRALRLLTDAWGNGPDVANGHLIEAAGMFVARHGDAVDLGKLAEKLRKATTPPDMIGAARGYKASNGGSLARAMHALIVKTYNSGRSIGNRLPEA